MGRSYCLMSPADDYLNRLRLDQHGSYSAMIKEQGTLTPERQRLYLTWLFENWDNQHAVWEHNKPIELWGAYERWRRINRPTFFEKLIDRIQGLLSQLEQRFVS